MKKTRTGFGVLCILIVCSILMSALSGCGKTQISGLFEDISPDAIPEPEHFDPTDFRAMGEEIEKCTDETEAFRLYDAMLAELEALYTQKTLFYTMYAENVNDAYAKEEREYSEALYLELYNEMLLAGNAVARRFGENFRVHLGSDWLYARYLDSDEIPRGVNELNERNSELVSEYYTLSSRKSSFSCVYKGTTYTIADLSDGEKCEGLTAEDCDAIYAGCMEAYNAAAGEIYLEMVDVRTEIARLYGYEDYVSYADERVYYRDYSEEALTSLYEAIRPRASLYQPISDTFSYLPYSGEDIDDAAWLASRLVKALPEEEQESFAVLMEDGLLIGGSGDSYMSGGYSEALPSVNSAVIYLKYLNDGCDIFTLMHELGHFTDFVVNDFNPMERLVLDISEVHSTGTEMLLLDSYDLAYSAGQSERIKAYELSQMLSCILYGCIFDQWQRIVYHDPDMTLEEINAAYRETALQYGITETDWLEYEWVDTHHNFEVPLYYMSYCTSALVSLQLYALAETDRQAALDTWTYILDCGSTTPYMETVEGAGLAPFTDTETTVSLFTDCAEEIAHILEKESK